MSTAVRLPACHVGSPPPLLSVGGGGFGPGPAGGPAHASRWRRWWRLALDGRAPPHRRRPPRASRRGGPVPRRARPPPSGPPRAPPPPCRHAGVVYTPTTVATASRPCPRFFFSFFAFGVVVWGVTPRPPLLPSWSWSPPPRWWCGQRPRRSAAVTPLDDCRRHPARPLARAGRWPTSSNRWPLPPRGAALLLRAVCRLVGDRVSSRADATASPAPRTSSPPAACLLDLVCVSRL